MTDEYATLREAALERDPAGFAALSSDERLEVVESQLKAHPALMNGITRHLYLAYYQQPTVLAGLGEPPRPPFPEGFEVEQTDSQLPRLGAVQCRESTGRAASATGHFTDRRPRPPGFRRGPARHLAAAGRAVSR